MFAGASEGDTTIATHLLSSFFLHFNAKVGVTSHGLIGKVDL